MAKPRPTKVDDVAPEGRKLTAKQASRLAEIAELDARELAGLSVAEITDKFRSRIDPQLLLFRRICGKVVKKDPVTGVEYPVPFATVHVEDTDCSLVAFFPKPLPWGWFFPFNCHREVLGTVKTDKCGNFCVWIPRFDIDWILRWRKRRICFPWAFLRPSLADLLDIDVLRPVPQRPVPPRPGPGPDPSPLAALKRLPQASIEALAGTAGRQLAGQLAALEGTRAFGAPEVAHEDLLDARAFETELPPPLPTEFRRALDGRADVAAETQAAPADVVRSTLAMHVGVADRALEGLDLGRYIGPFFRCFDVYLPEWQLIVDVPDITFRVTQDTNGDGTEETIYSEGYFDIRWNAGPIPNVKLMAAANARESHLCETPDVPCGNVPAILFAGLMPLTDTNYFDAAAGYAKRPNRPIPPMGPRPAAKTPFLSTLQLYGCVNVPGAHFYRVLLSTDGGATFSAVTGLQWNIYPIPSGPPVAVSADANGWYPVLANPDDFHPARMILEWPTPLVGKHVLKVEIGDASKNAIQSSANVAIQVDNTSPTVIFNTLRWKFASEPDSAFNLAGRNLLVTCPTVRRGATPQDIDVEMEATVSANHLRDGYIYAASCDGSGIPPLAAPAPVTSHWHDSVSDNTTFLHARYRIAASELEGAYTFGCRGNSRAMNPAGGDGGHLADWFYDPVYRYSQPEIRVAIVNA